MNEAVKWMMAGMFLLSFHIDFMGIPIVPGIVGCLVFRSGFRMLEREGDGEGFEWNRKMEQTGRPYAGRDSLRVQYVELLRRAWQAVYAKLQKRTFLPWIPHMDDSRAGVL